VPSISIQQLGTQLGNVYSIIHLSLPCSSLTLFDKQSLIIANVVVKVIGLVYKDKSIRGFFNLFTTNDFLTGLY
jgi:hypothetical protein